MLKAVIFDLDHTLFDRHATLRAIVPALRRAFSVDETRTDDEIAAIWQYADDNFILDGWSYIFACLVENGVFTSPASYEQYRSFVYENFAKTAVPFDYALPMLTRLKEKGYKIGLITNGQHALQYKKLKLIGLSYIFDEIIVSGDYMVEKPSKEIFLLMCEKLSLEPGECVYVGDNRKNDVDGAAGAGMKTVWVQSTNVHQSGRSEPDAAIRTLKELENLDMFKNQNFCSGSGLIKL
ncbi:MAG: HAD family hydrolase [Clostridia bacterium]|nr:HAD family hydrolase [Clostridia bacterium]